VTMSDAHVLELQTGLPQLFWVVFWEFTALLGVLLMWRSATRLP